MARYLALAYRMHPVSVGVLHCQECALLARYIRSLTPESPKVSNLAECAASVLATQLK
jgi:hypothetical protein